LGLLLSGIGGGSPEFGDDNSFFLAGGGGGGFFPKPPGAAGAWGAGDVLDPPAKLFTLPAMPYFWLSPLAARQPEAACSPCRCWKLFAVEAAPFRSEAETLDGSLRKLLAVLRAACLSAHDVPVAGADSAGDEAVILANRFCNSWSCGPLPAVAGGDSGADVDELELWRAGGGGGAIVRPPRGGTGGEAVRPIPNPGTDTPAWPKRFMAPWLRTGAAGCCCIASPYEGGAGGVYSSTFSVWRGGSLGGRPGGFDREAGAGGGVAAFGRKAGGLGRFAVLNPVVSVL
jgi:hypothetical protein